MTDDHLTKLFAEGTAPARDATFVRRIDAQIAAARRALRVQAFTIRAVLLATLAATMFVMVRALEWALDQISASTPQIMGVPLPLVLAALIVGLVVRSRSFGRLRLS
jgi:hypothetical protein